VAGSNRDPGGAGNYPVGDVCRVAVRQVGRVRTNSVFAVGEFCDGAAADHYLFERIAIVCLE